MKATEEIKLWMNTIGRNRCTRIFYRGCPFGTYECINGKTKLDNCPLPDIKEHDREMCEKMAEDIIEIVCECLTKDRERFANAKLYVERETQYGSILIKSDYNAVLLQLKDNIISKINNKYGT